LGLRVNLFNNLRKYSMLGKENLFEVPPRNSPDKQNPPGQKNLAGTENYHHLSVW
jgi:hypothetical protein